MRGRPSKHLLTLSPSKPLTLSPSHPLTLLRSHTRTLSHSHTLTLSHSHTLLSHSHPRTLSRALPHATPCLESREARGERHGCLALYYTGLPRLQETAPPWDSTVGVCLGPYGGPGGSAFSYERGTPVQLHMYCKAPSWRQGGA